MTPSDPIIDRIHYLADRACALTREGRERDAMLLFRQAEELANQIREVQEVYS